MEIRKALPGLTAVISLCAVGQLFAQEPRPAQPGGQNQPAASRATNQPAQSGQRAGWRTDDQTLATCVIIDNQAGIAFAQFAQSKAQNNEVKEFAAMLVREHQEFASKLERFAPGAARNSLSTERQTNATGTERQTTDRQTNPGVQPAGGAALGQQPGRGIQQTGGTQPGSATSGSSIDFVQLHREMTEQCLADAKKRLSEKQGDEFDACFIGLQIASHAAMESKLTVLQRHASGELAQVLKEGSQITEKHLNEAEKVMEKLADSSKKSGSQQRDRKAEKSE
jgi:predicted outer membrane protein